jgi:hypothetical protein
LAEGGPNGRGGNAPATAIRSGSTGCAVRRTHRPHAVPGQEAARRRVRPLGARPREGPRGSPRFRRDRAGQPHEDASTFGMSCSDPSSARLLGGPGMQCARCQHENPAGVKFCGECGARLNSVMIPSRPWRRRVLSGRLRHGRRLHLAPPPRRALRHAGDQDQLPGPVSEGILVAEAQVVERTKGSSHVARGTRRPLIRSIQMKRSAHGLRGSTALW